MNSQHKGHQSYELGGLNMLSSEALVDHIKNLHKLVGDIESSFAWSESMLDEFLKTRA